MFRNILFFLSLPLFFSLEGVAPPTPAEATALLNRGLNEFTFAFYRQAIDSPGSLIISPLNLSTALSIPYLGAEGDTQKQMQEHIYYPKELPGIALAEAFSNLEARYSRGEGFQLQSAAALWIQLHHPIRYAYQRMIQSHYHGGLHEIDFTHSAEAIEGINKWVKRETGGKIKDLLQPNTVDHATQLVAVSALYLQAPWSLPFDPKETAEQPFYTSQKEQVKVPLMVQRNRLPYVKGEGYQFVVLPCARGEGAMQLALVLLLPDAVDGLSDLEKQVDARFFQRALEATHFLDLSLFLPRFQISTRVYARELLEEMGITDPFTPKADFSQIDGKRDLILNTVVHQAEIQVHEAGLEVAAASAASIGVTSTLLEEPTLQVRADHPFLFFVADLSNQQILFMGRLTHPGVHS